MSLVNDVLRGLDDRQVVPARGLPFPGQVSSKRTKSKIPYQKALLIVISILVVILSIQVIYNKSLIQLLSSHSTEQIIVNDETELVESDSNTSAVPANEKIEPSITPMLSLSRIENIKMHDAKKGELNSISDDVSPALFVAEVISEVKPEKIISRKLDASAENSAAIKKVIVAGSMLYQRAIREYKQHRYSAALIDINAAINKNSDEKYQVLKARILLKQKDELGFLQFVKQERGNASLNWFQLVAPGLQLLSYYELSNQYYLQLIKQQPDNIKWPLAMALNYSSLGKVAKTHQIYQNLLTSNQLSMKQKQWISSQVQSLEKSLNFKVGHQNGS